MKKTKNFRVKSTFKPFKKRMMGAVKRLVLIALLIPLPAKAFFLPIIINVPTTETHEETEHEA